MVAVVPVDATVTLITTLDFINGVVAVVTFLNVGGGGNELS